MASCKRADFGYEEQTGYYRTSSKIAGQRAVHRIVYVCHHKVELTSDQVVRHLCNNKWCIEITHLALGTSKDNAHDKIAAGTDPKGERNGRARLTQEDVLRIKKQMKHRTYKDIAQEYGVSLSTIGEIARKASWK